jgi:hypothetical protein
MLPIGAMIIAHPEVTPFSGLEELVKEATLQGASTSAKASGSPLSMSIRRPRSHGRKQ